MAMCRYWQDYHRPDRLASTAKDADSDTQGLEYSDLEPRDNNSDEGTLFSHGQYAENVEFTVDDWLIVISSGSVGADNGAKNTITQVVHLGFVEVSDWLTWTTTRRYD